MPLPVSRLKYPCLAASKRCPAAQSRVRGSRSRASPQTGHSRATGTGGKRHGSVSFNISFRYPRAVKPTQLELLTTVSAPALAPDGSAADRCGLPAELRAPTPPSGSSGSWTRPGAAAPRRLTRGVRDTDPRYSPDGSAVAFLRADAKGRPQLAVVDARGRRAARADRPAAGRGGVRVVPGLGAHRLHRRQARSRPLRHARGRRAGEGGPAPDHRMEVPRERHRLHRRPAPRDLPAGGPRPQRGAVRGARRPRGPRRRFRRGPTPTAGPAGRRGAGPRVPGGPPAHAGGPRGLRARVLPGRHAPVLHGRAARGGGPGPAQHGPPHPPGRPGPAAAGGRRRSRRPASPTGPRRSPATERTLFLLGEELGPDGLDFVARNGGVFALDAADDAWT